jgi:hypothetical protein
MKMVAAVTAFVLSLGLVSSASSSTVFASGADASTPRDIGTGSANVCLDTDVSDTVGTAAPGDLLAPPQDLTIESGLIEGRIYRVLYGTSAPGGKTRAACTMIAVPAGESINSFLVEGHGALGLQQACLPSMNVRNFVQDVTPDSQGRGPLFSTVKSGGVWVAPDFPAAGVGGNDLQPFGHGVGQGVSILDAARVVTRNAPQFGLAPIAPNAQLPLVVSGYSQGGGAALWAAQLASYYFRLQKDNSLNLAGVMAYEPPTHLVSSPRESQTLDGFHLADRMAYRSVSGSVYLGWVAQAWSQMTRANVGPIPFGPSPNVRAAALLSKDGLLTSKEVIKYCSTQVLQLGLAVAKYRDADKHRLLRSPFAGSKSNASWSSAIDRTCRQTKGVSKEARNICAWLRFNNAGPNGVNPFPKIPTNNLGSVVPMYLAHGLNDSTVWCVDDEGPVEARNCLTAQFYESVAPEYCAGQGHLRVDYFPGISHGDIYRRNFTNLATGAFYDGSPFQEFVEGAVAGTLPRTCEVAIRK